MRSLEQIARSNAPPIVLGLDPGFASIGWAKVRIYSRTEEVIALGVFHTEKSTKKQGVLSVEDNVRRTREVACFFAEMCINRNLHKERVTVVCAESMSFPRNASAAAKVAMSWGALVATLERCGDLPLVQASPQEVKLAVCGRKDASKLDVLQALRARYGAKFDRACNAAGCPPSMLEHPVDALAVIVACLDSEVVRLARRALA